MPAEERRAKIKPISGDLAQMSAAQKANRQTIDRYIKGDVKAFPADLEEAWVKALPEPFYGEALRVLAATAFWPRAARRPRVPLATVGDVLELVGEVAQRMAPIISKRKDRCR